MRPIKAVSSANLMRGHFELCDLQSDVYNVNRNAVNTVPWRERGRERERERCIVWFVAGYFFIKGEFKG